MENIDQARVPNTDTPLAVSTPAKLPEGESCVLGYLDYLVCLNGREWICDASVTCLLLRLFLRAFRRAGASAHSRGGIGADAAVADMSWQSIRYGLAALARVFARARVLQALEIPEEGLTFLIPGGKDWVTTELMEEVESYIELISVWQGEL